MLQRKSPHQFKPTIVGIPEEVGMDIVEALEVLDIKYQKLHLEKKSAFRADPRKKCQRFQVKQKINQALLKPCITKVKKEPFKVVIEPPPMSDDPNVMRKLHKEFISQLKNECKNKPLPSSSTLVWDQLLSDKILRIFPRSCLK